MSARTEESDPCGRIGDQADPGGRRSAPDPEAEIGNTWEESLSMISSVRFPVASGRGAERYSSTGSARDAGLVLAPSSHS